MGIPAVRLLKCHGHAAAPLVILSTIVSGCLGGTNGVYRGSGGLGNWEMHPNTCQSGLHRGFLGVDIYRRRPGEDTEVVIMNDMLAGPLVLVRVPNENRTVLFTRSDCKVMEVEMGRNGVEINRVPGLSGHARFECERASTGRFSGQGEFNCY
jgi:hypothetical protein